MISDCQILNGKETASRYLEKFSKEIAVIQNSGKKISLVGFRVGENNDALLYAKSIDDLMKKIGVQYTTLRHSADVAQEALEKEIAEYSKYPHNPVTGILIFAPLPKHLKLEAILNRVNTLKEAEGRRLPVGNKWGIAPPTAAAAITLFEETGVPAEGKEALVIGRSDVVGKPAAMMLLQKNATVTIAHSKTKNLEECVKRADIVIASIGKPEFIKGEWIKPGAVVIDVGENSVNGKLVGDVHFDSAKARASFISPVPGGVGPLTNVMLVKNLIALHKLQEAHNGNR